MRVLLTVFLIALTACDKNQPGPGPGPGPKPETMFSVTKGGLAVIGTMKPGQEDKLPSLKARVEMGVSILEP